MITTQSLGRTKYQADMTQPQIPPAGITSKLNDTAKDALNWGERPPTPDGLKKYRQSTIHEPGKIVRHPGTADDRVPHQGPFGVKTVDGQNVVDTMVNYPESELSRWKIEQSEAIYASSKREPLGQGYVRGHKIPEGLGDERPFGVAYDSRGKELSRQAATVIFPTDRPAGEDPATHTQYVRSHADYEPGEQRRRDYNWQSPGIDPANHRFGAVDPNPQRNGVAAALQPALDPGLQGAKVLPKVHEDFKATATDYLGRPKQLGTGERGLPPDHAFGVPSMRKGHEPGVGELLSSLYPPAEREPDADLGKSLREGFRNTAKPGDEGRTFGVPTIRTDLRAPRQRSVANTQNFGNESDAGQVLRPPLAADLGIPDEEFVALKPRAALRALVEDAGLALGEEEFEAAWALAADADGGNAAAGGTGGGGEARACIDTFFRARHHLLAQTLHIEPPF